MLSYTNAHILAPMVRIGTLPARLLALKYGADIVYTEELIDHKILECTRKENKVLGTVDFVLPDGEVVLSTCSAEREKVVFQMGTSCPERALKAAQLVSNDVAGIDINMGCPKHFSIVGGMGAALLKQPEQVRKILTSLVQGLKQKPITCKIRMLQTKEETLNLVEIIKSTGVKAIGIHARLKEQRSSTPVTAPHIELLREISKSSEIPIIANGWSLDINDYNDIVKSKDVTGCNSIMLARAAQWNLSVFRKEGLLSADEVVRDYLRAAVEWDNAWDNSKYVVMTLYRNHHTSESGRRLRQCRSLKEMCEVFGISADYERLMAARTEKAKELGERIVARRPGSEDDVGPRAKRARVERVEEKDVHIMDIKFDPLSEDFKKTRKTSGKNLLVSWCMRNEYVKPEWECEMIGRKFSAVLKMCGERYSSSYHESNKKRAIQTASAVAIRHLDLKVNEEGTKIIGPNPKFG